MSRFVFLDRDGTLVEDTGYTHRLEDFRLLPGVPDALARLIAAGWRLAVVTNQSGIGRGYYGEADYQRFQARLVAELGARGVEIAASYFCPPRPDAGCACRKPAPGLLERARDELGADLAASWVVGDRGGDVALARQAGCAGAVLVLTGIGAEEDPKVDAGVPRARDLGAAVERILAATPP